MNIKMDKYFIKHLTLWYLEKALDIEFYEMAEYLVDKYIKYIKYMDLSYMEG